MIGAIERRKLILRVLLGSLAAAAVAGVLAVLLPIDDVVVRVMITGCTTAVAAALALPLSLLLERSNRRPSGLFGMTVLTLEFLLSLVLIWLEPLIGSRLGENLGLTMLFLFLVSLPTMVFLLMARSTRARVAGIVGLIFAAATLACLMIATWHARGFISDEWAGTGGLVGLFGTIIVFTLTDVGMGARRAPPLWLRTVGIMGATAGLIATIVDVWDGPDNDSVEAFTISIGALGALVTLLHLADLEGRQRWVRHIAIWCGVATAAVVNLIVFAHGNMAEDLLERAAAATGIVTACASMAVLVLTALNRRVQVDRRQAALLQLTIVCPRCRKKQAIKVGDAKCGGCGLGISIRIEEPCCPQCGYNLYGLESRQCPECGTPVAGPARPATSP